MSPKAFKPPGPSEGASNSRNMRRANVSRELSSSPSRSPSPATRRSSAVAGRRSTGNADAGSSSIVEQTPLLPPLLLTRLLQHHFQDPTTKISGEASTLMAKYLDTYVREALVRAKAEMDEKNGGQGGDFLEVEDLEKLAPQLCLDF